MYVWFPNWPIQRRRHARPGPEPEGSSSAPLPAAGDAGRRPAGNREPLVLFAPAERNRIGVVACSEAARRHGVRPGMLLAEAQALCPSAGRAAAHFELHDPQADREALRQLAFWGGQFSPSVAIDPVEPPDGLVLDVTGCGYGYGGEEGLAAETIASLRRGGWWAAAAIAGTTGAAWAVAHHGIDPRHEDPRVLIVPPGQDGYALNSLPVAALRLSAGIVQLLREFDVCRVEQLLALRRADLPSRFGPELLLRLDQALGIVPEVLAPERSPEVAEAAWTFEPPVADRQVLETVVGHLLGKLVEQLQPRQLGVQRLLCSLQLAGGEPMHFPVDLLRPGLSLRHLADLVRLHVERLTIPSEIAAVALRAALVGPLEYHQGQLFDGGDGSGRQRQVAALLEQLSSRLGEKSVLRPHLRPDPQPEFACAYEPWLGRPAAPRPDSHVAEPRDHVTVRPPWLKAQPVAVAVASIIPHGPPIQFHWEGQHHVVAHCWGPERIETGWWRGDDVRRDYYLVETTAGERFWLFRTADEERWFMHGVFA